MGNFSLEIVPCLEKNLYDILENADTELVSATDNGQHPKKFRGLFLTHHTPFILPFFLSIVII
jgi:hypothetical protein